jgi:uncharacterized membrane protein
MVEKVKEEVEDTAEEVKNGLPGSNHDGFARKVLLPAAAGLGTVAATYAARKAPDLIRGQLMPKLEAKGSDEAANVGKQAAQKLEGQSGVMGALAGKLGGGEGGGGGGGGKKTRRLPIQRWTDIALPVDKVYETWVDFDKFPTFMHRVLSVEAKDDKRVKWREKIWFSTREWEGEITDRRQNDRIAWKTKSGTNHSGVVSFHQISDNLTRVMVTVEFQPTGMMEKMASGMRFAKRAVQSDLARFKAYVELEDAKGLHYGQGQADSEGDKSDSKDKSDSNGDDNAADEEMNRSRSSRGSSSTKNAEELTEAQKERAERREQRRH